MISKWPTMWRHQVAEDLGIEPTQFVLNVLSAWRSSTPLEPWTNNPTGLDAKASARPPLANTRYALFPAMSDYRKAMQRIATTTPGKGLVAVLAHEGTYTEAWKAIRALNTPGVHVEDEYPSRVLDMAAKAYEESIPERKAGKRKTAGLVNPSPQLHADIHRQSKLLHHAANNIQDTARAIEHIMRGLS